MITLHRDTYYRGYRLVHLPDGQVKVYWEIDYLETTLTEGMAKRTIDAWLDAK